mgnify:CR=1 FL=1
MISFNRIVEEIQFKVSDKVLSRFNHVKYLGVTIDDQISLVSMLNVMQISTVTAVIYKMPPYVYYSVKLYLYYAFVLKLPLQSLDGVKVLMVMRN